MSKCPLLQTCRDEAAPHPYCAESTDHHLHFNTDQWRGTDGGAVIGSDRKNQLTMGRRG